MKNFVDKKFLKSIGACRLSRSELKKAQGLFGRFIDKPISLEKVVNTYSVLFIRIGVLKTLKKLEKDKHLDYDLVNKIHERFYGRGYRPMRKVGNVTVLMEEISTAVARSRWRGSTDETLRQLKTLVKLLEEEGIDLTKLRK